MQKINDESLKECTIGIEALLKKDKPCEETNENKDKVKSCGNVFEGMAKKGEMCSERADCIDSFCHEDQMTCESSCLAFQQENEVCNYQDKQCDEGLECDLQANGDLKCIKEVVNSTSIEEAKKGDTCNIESNGDSSCGYDVAGLYCNPESLKCDDVTIAEIGEDCFLNGNRAALCKNRSTINTCLEDESSEDSSKGKCVKRAEIGEDCSKNRCINDLASCININFNDDSLEASYQCSAYLVENDACINQYSAPQCGNGLDCFEEKCTKYENIPEEMCMPETDS